MISFPGAKGGTEPTSINDQGVIVGDYFLSSEDHSHGFMWKNGVFSNINPPDSNGSAFVTKISNTGAIVGSYVSAVDDHFHGFSFDNRTYTKIDGPCFQDTFIQAVNKFDNVIAVGPQGTTNVQVKGSAPQCSRSTSSTLRETGFKAFSFTEGGIQKNRVIGSSRNRDIVGSGNAKPYRGSTRIDVDQTDRESLLPHINHCLVFLSALSIFVVLLNGDRLIIFCEGDGPGAR
jgi:uncharacterized membrane protein